MAMITLKELYRGEGTGAKYGGIMNRVAAELLTRGHPVDYDEQTWLELQMAEQMRKEGDCVSDLSDAQSPSCCEEVLNEND